MSTEEIKFDCPECSEGLAIDRRAIGHQVACPFCKVPITVPDETKPVELPAASPSLEELASSRPELSAQIPASEPTRSTPISPPAVDAGGPAEKREGASQSAGLPPKRKPGEKPKSMAEEAAANPSAAVLSPERAVPPTPPVSRSRPPLGESRPSAAAPTKEPRALRPARPNGSESEVPAGYEEKVRRKRKRRNPDEHRLNPREHPKMVAFDEVVGDNTFRKHPGRGKMPFFKKLGLLGVILGILAAIGLGILKQMQLNEPDDNLTPIPLSAIEKEFEIANERLEAFRTAASVEEKMSFVRVPITMMDGYPTLEERMNDYYSRNTLNAHFPRLDRATATVIEQGETEFFRVAMENKRVNTFLYFEKAAAGYALDWDSFVGYNPKSWTEFLVNPSGDSGSGVFRLIVTRSDHYTGIYQDEAKYRSYSVTDFNSSMNAIAYVVRETAAEEAIEAEFEKLKMRDEQQVLVIAQINLVERGVDGSNLIYIDKVLRSSWLLP
jgi:hypothetical protein